MKILYILNKFPTLSETFILNEIIELLDRGHDVHILSVYKPTEGLIHEQILKRNLLDRTKYFGLSSSRRELEYFMGLIDFLRLFSGQKEPSSSHRARILDLWDKTFQGGEALRSLFCWIRETKINHLHAHFAGDSARMGYIIHKALEIPYTLTTHAYDLFVGAPKSKKVLFDAAKKVITVSEFNKNYIAKNFQISSERIKVVRCGLDLKSIRPVPRYSLAPFRIVSVSRLVEKKGYPYLIKACRILKDRGHSFFCEIVGDGPMRTAIEILIRKNELTGEVRLGGAKTREKVQEFIRTGSVFVLPCLVAPNQDMDGIPVVLMEAMALEIPVISTDVSGVPELIDDGINGWLVPQKDAAALAVAIIKLKENPLLVEKIRKAGREKVLAGFDIQDSVDNLEKCFSQQSA